MFEEGDTVIIKNTNSWTGYKYLKGQKGFATLKVYKAFYGKYDEIVFFSKKSLEIIGRKEGNENYPIINLNGNNLLEEHETCKMLLLETEQVYRI